MAMTRRVLVLSQEEIARTLQMTDSDYRPDEILRLKARIAHETELCEAQAVKNGRVDEGHVREIVAMRLELDGLYLDWTEGKIS